MKEKEEEYREIFLAEALENYEEINRLLTNLEKAPGDKNTIHALFRITHTLKGNSSGMGYSAIAELSHTLEDLFGEIRSGSVALEPQTFTSIFKAVDVLGHLIRAVQDQSDVKYKGIKTKLEVLIRRSREESGKERTQNELSETGNEASDNDTDDRATSDEGENKISFSDLVQVPVRKLDNLLNLVGELMIEKDRILASQSANGIYASNEFSRLSRISSDLQYSVMDVRLVQVGFVFRKFHRVVRDAASVESKNVVLKLEGSDTEIDRNVLQIVSDSLIHIIRNCVGHGIETPEERIALGKPEEGVITLTASNENDAVMIEISDDGRGINYEKVRTKAIERKIITSEEAELISKEALNMLIFEPGFSTMDEVTSISGRGVGMDVVKKTLDSIGGTIRVASTEGKGTVIQLTLPSSMAVKSCLLFEVEHEVFAIPLSYTDSVISIYPTEIHKAGGGLIATHQGKNFTLVFLSDIFSQQAESNGHANGFQHTYHKIHPEQKLEVIIVKMNSRTVGFVVDKLLQQKEIVEKPLMRPLDKSRFISGVTILGTGNVCLVLNIPQILQFVFTVHNSGKTLRNFTLN